MEWAYGQVNAPTSFIGQINVDPDSAPFWKELAGGHVSAQRCDSCATYRFPPGPHCLSCGSSELRMVALTSTPTLFSWIVVNRPTHPSLPAPYAVAIAEFPEGVRIPGALLVPQGVSELRIGQPLRVQLNLEDQPFVVLAPVLADERGALPKEVA